MSNDTDAERKSTVNDDVAASPWPVRVGGEDSESHSLLDSFRQHWERGERVTAEDFVRRHPLPESSDELLLDIVFAEFVAREQRGEHPSVDEYVKRFPALSDRLSRLFSVDRAIRDMPQE